MNDGTVLFAGGGSGGHLSPAIAIAERLRDEPDAPSILFACSRRPIDRVVLDPAGVRYEPIHAAPFSLRPLGFGRFLLALTRGSREVTGLIRREKVRHVVAMGGFVSAPAVLAARRRGVSVTLLNLDAPPGLANRLLARLCDEVLSAIEVPEQPRFSRNVVGMPVRRAACAGHDQVTCRAKLGLAGSRPTLLVTGASQGATSLNTLLPTILEHDGSCLGGWQVVHLCGERDRDRLREAYEQAGVPARVESYLDEIGLAWGAADLAVSRAGASSVAEAWVNEVPTVFLPYPYHRDQHQRRNAQPMVEAGGAVIVEDHVEPDANRRGAGRVISRLLSDGDTRDAMRSAMAAEPARDGADAVARLIRRRLAGSGVQ